MINKKRGRKGTTNNKKVHSSNDFDNILRKIQVNFLGFIIAFLNDVNYNQHLLISQYRLNIIKMDV